MAKMLRRERAWEFFIGEFTGAGPIKGFGGFNRSLTRSWRRAGREEERFFWKLVRVLDEFGITVLKHRDLGKSTDAFGQEFSVGGTWNVAGKGKVNLIRESPRTLAHEFTHAMDYLQRGHYGRSSGELVACAGGYLISSHYGRFILPASGSDTPSAREPP